MYYLIIFEKAVLCSGTVKNETWEQTHLQLILIIPVISITKLASRIQTIVSITNVHFSIYKLVSRITTQPDYESFHNKYIHIR